MKLSSLNPFNLFKIDTIPGVPTQVSVNRENLIQVQITTGKVAHAVIFKKDPDSNNYLYQICSLDSNRVQLAGAKSGNKVTIPDSSLNLGSIDERSWKPTGIDLLGKDTLAVQNIASDIFKAEKNYKIVKLFNWSSRTIVNITSTITSTIGNTARRPYVKRAALIVVIFGTLLPAIHYLKQYGLPIINTACGFTATDRQGPETWRQLATEIKNMIITFRHNR